jgi:hypothetical protein
MHSNYRKSFARQGAAALPQGSIRQDRPGVPACASADALESNDLMR